MTVRLEKQKLVEKQSRQSDSKYNFMQHVFFDKKGIGSVQLPRTRTTGFGPRSFSVSGPLAWNSLPPEIKTTSLTLGQFSARLKTELFIHSYYASAQPS